MTPAPAYCSPLGPVIAAHLALQQSLGRQFHKEARVLAGLDRFLAPPGPEALTADSFAAWVLSLGQLAPQTRRAYMLIVRRLAIYASRTDPDGFVPDLAQFPARAPARSPFLLSRLQVLALLQEADRLPATPGSPLLPAVYRLAVVLLYTAGLRRGELLRLRLDDYDRSRRTLLLRVSKFRKSRLVALSADAERELQGYLGRRQAFSPKPDAPLLAHGPRTERPYSASWFGEGFRRLCRAAGVLDGEGRPPRVHDLRHTHAAHVLLGAYRDGREPQALLPALATAMGHVSLASTAHYLTLIDPVLEAAAERVAQRVRPIIAPGPGGRRA